MIFYASYGGGHLSAARSIKENIEAKIFEIKTELEDLDKETVLKVAKSKAKDLDSSKWYLNPTPTVFSSHCLLPLLFT